MKELTNEDKIKLLDYIIVDLKDSIINFNPNRYTCCTMLRSNYGKHIHKNYINSIYKVSGTYELNIKAVFPEFHDYIVYIGTKLSINNSYSTLNIWNIKGTAIEGQMFRLKRMQYLRQKLKKQFGL